MVGRGRGWKAGAGLEGAPPPELQACPRRRTEQWPRKLYMQLIPQQLLVSGEGRLPPPPGGGGGAAGLASRGSQPG